MGINPSELYKASLAIQDHQTEVNVSHLNPQSDRTVLDLPIPEGWKAELT